MDPARQNVRMGFIMNALDDGWSVKKRQETYVFTKRHENRREVWGEEYLEDFVKQMATIPVRPAENR